MVAKIVAQVAAQVVAYVAAHVVAMTLLPRTIKIGTIEATHDGNALRKIYNGNVAQICEKTITLSLQLKAF